MATIWYLWAVNNDPRTSEYIAREIIGGQEVEVHECPNKPCARGVRRNLYRCPKGYADVQSALAAIQKFSLHIEVFKEEVGESKSRCRKVTRFDLWKGPVRKKARLSYLLRHPDSQGNLI